MSKKNKPLKNTIPKKSKNTTLIKTKTSALKLAELEMYKDYLRYVPVEKIAIKYAMSAEGVYKIAQKNQWKKKRLKAKELAYKNLDKKYRQQIVDIVKFVQHDYMLLMQKCLTEKREMTMQERGYVLSLLEKLTKENRLNEGKPTDITEGNHLVRHEVLLPAGVRRFGVIPPGPNVTQVEAAVVKPVEPTPEEKIDYDDEDL